MSKPDRFNRERRKVLTILGYGAAAVPLASLGACSGEKAPPPAADPEPEAAMQDAAAAADDAGEAMSAPAAQEAAAQQQLAPLSEDDPSAKSLGYVADASTVDTEKYPRYQAGQACSNCALYMGGDAPEGACSIFPGKAVKAAGWCNVYAPKS